MKFHPLIEVARLTTAAALWAFTVALAASASALPVSAQTYPDRRITFIVPYPAGGATDVSARLLATKLSDAWKQTVVVENKSGAGGIIGNDFVAKAPADGYTVLIAITQIIQAPSLVSKLPYDVFKGSRAGHPGRVVTDRPHRSRRAADEIVQGPDRSRQSQSRQISLRNVRQRNDISPLRRTSQEDRRDRHDSRALSRLGAAAE